MVVPHLSFIQSLQAHFPGPAYPILAMLSPPVSPLHLLHPPPTLNCSGMTEVRTGSAPPLVRTRSYRHDGGQVWLRLTPRQSSVHAGMTEVRFDTLCLLVSIVFPLPRLGPRRHDESEICLQIYPRQRSVRAGMTRVRFALTLRIVD